MWGSKFFLWDEKSCWVCSSRKGLTAEHKFKASDLRTSFGSEEMLGLLGHDPEIESYERELQSPRSKFAKFRASICAECNNARTQKHDRAYDELSTRLRQLMKESREPFEVSREEPWCNGLNPTTISSLRYFGKHLGCIAAEIGMPIPSALPLYVLEQVEHCQLHPAVYSRTDLKKIITEERKFSENFSRVGHSGLAIMFDNEITTPKAYRVGIEIDWALVEIRYEFSESEVYSLCNHFPDHLHRARRMALKSQAQ